jgi:uncharacterized protein (TIGR03083 family)
MRQPQPVLVADRFPEILDALLDLLSSLTPDEWQLQTACAGWSVRDVALHLLGDDVGMLSSRRDGYRMGNVSIAGWDDLVAFINDQNARWVQTTRRISPRLLADLLRLTGEQVSAYFQSLDPYAQGVVVDWAGPEPAPVWLDLAREYTERWHHQQHIRDAVKRPGLLEPRYLAPALDTFVRALPHTYRDVGADDGTLVSLTVAGESGGRWFMRRERGEWRLYVEASQPPQTEVIIDQNLAWRLFTRGLSKEEALAQATVRGDPLLAARMLEVVSIIA